MAGLSSLTASMSTEFRWQASQNITGSPYNPIQNSGDIRKSQSISTSAANTAAGGGDEVYSFQQIIAGAGAYTLDLFTITDILARSGSIPKRIKAFQFRVLSSTDDPLVTSNAASTVTVSNIGPYALASPAFLPSSLVFNNGGSGATVALTVGGGGVVTGIAIGVGGTGYPPLSFFLASPQQSTGVGCIFVCGTNAAGVITSMTFTAIAAETGGITSGGINYTGATVPLVPVGQCNILSGGTYMYFDPTLLGTVISATSRHIFFRNMDAVNGVTLEIDLLGGST